MPRIDLCRRRPVLGALAILLACTCLAACGSSSGGSKSGSQASGSSPLEEGLSEGAQNKVYDKALSKYADCLRQHGVNVPKPKASKGQPATLDTQGMDTTTPRFKRAVSSCSTTLNEALRIDAGEAYEAKQG